MIQRREESDTHRKCAQGLRRLQGRRHESLRRARKAARRSLRGIAGDDAVYRLQKRASIYEQVYNGILRLAALGVLKPGDLPSVRAVAAQAGVNPNTVQKAYAMLERDGAIQSVPGRGRSSPSMRSSRTAGGARRWKISERPWRRPCRPA